MLSSVTSSEIGLGLTAADFNYLVFLLPFCSTEDFQTLMRMFF